MMEKRKRRWFWKRDDRSEADDELRQRVVNKRLDDYERRLKNLEAEVEVMTGKKLATG